MNIPTFILCNQCNYYHDATQSPATEKRYKWNRYSPAELDDIFGQGGWMNSVLQARACPSGKGPVIKEIKKAQKPTAVKNQKRRVAA